MVRPVSSVNEPAEGEMAGALSQSRRPYAFIIKMLPGLVLVLDCLVLLAVGYVSYAWLVYYSYQTVDFYTVAIIGNSMLAVMLLYFAGLYQFGAITRVGPSMDRIVLANLTAFILMLAAAFTIKISDVYSRLWVGSFLVGGTLGLILARSLISWGITRLGERSIIARSVAVFGQGEQVEELLKFLKEVRPAFINVVKVFGDGATVGKSRDNSFKDNGYSETEFNKLAEFVRMENVDDVVVAMPWASSRAVASLVGRLREMPINVFLSSDLVGYKISMRPPPNYFDTIPLFQVSGKPLTGWDIVLKTIEDYVLALFFVIVLSPLLLIVAMLVKLDSPGPVLFKQKRLGFNNQEFEIYKFRSMTHSEVAETKTVQAQKQDARVTRIGALLRRSSIDELPQLFNVLNGTMSIVGPRPHAIDHNEEFATKIRGYFSRHRVKPGLTGLAQVNGFRGITDTVEKMENRVKNDIEYAENWSLLMDMKILIKTPFLLVLGTNAH